MYFVVIVHVWNKYSVFSVNGLSVAKGRVSSDVVALCSSLGPVSVVNEKAALTNREKMLGAILSGR